MKQDLNNSGNNPTRPQGFLRSFWRGRGSFSKSLILSLVLSVAAMLLFRNSFIFFFVFPLYPLQVAFNNFRWEYRKGRKE